ncbi:uncharacterized protein SETTUDRAFT_150713 [Exserohilum turcica Et28A]|uniref:MYND-type domain-containing protein n=1 Tax=Exserohilum turcicum (strain 28A) TaxID=671987 RepID=R0IS43_EXST2|nr:uncharacterized protein SETTUDRAFT_150713 [Exserohilum turcica Et28A]EOA87650.1 hypothetical protein SETTUDRAFT_150713 [Exserohilum turcica Et28A]
MTTKLVPLTDFRLPDYPDAPLTLNGAPLSIVDTSSLPPEGSGTNNSDNTITPAIGLATLLYKWHPNALAAFLDLDAWFSMTWTLSIAPGTPSGPKIEIGRIGNQITFGSLDSSGENWKLMLTYNIVKQRNSTKHKTGTWIPNPKESMIGERDVTSPAIIEALAQKFMAKCVRERRWETGKKMKHGFWVEYAPMDVWGDGIPMSPHWLYKGLDLSVCTACGKKNCAENDTALALQRCGRCGTATYCSDACQKGDWAVHKHVCQMGMEDRGQAIKLVEKGGLIRWDEDKTFASEAGEMSRNPNLQVPQLKRSRIAE